MSNLKAIICTQTNSDVKQKLLNNYENNKKWEIIEFINSIDYLLLRRSKDFEIKKKKIKRSYSSLHFEVAERGAHLKNLFGLN